VDRGTGKDRADLHPEDRERIIKIIDNVFIKSISDGEYDVEYRTVGVEDQKTRWVRAMGKTYFSDQVKPLRFVGTVLEITERKEGEIRKNEFIGIASVFVFFTFYCPFCPGPVKHDTTYIIFLSPLTLALFPKIPTSPVQAFRLDSNPCQRPVEVTK